jgi:putative tricarboxylic transport membrane protein
MNTRQRDLWISLIWLGIAIAICIGSVRLSLGQVSVPGPGLFSFLCGGVMGILAIVVFVQTIRLPSGGLVKSFCSNPQKFLKMIYAFIALVVYSIAMDYLGFTFSTLLFLGFFLRAIQPQKWLVVFVFSILPTICAYLVFKSWLDVQLPGGFFGF